MNIVTQSGFRRVASVVGLAPTDYGKVIRFNNADYVVTGVAIGPATPRVLALSLDGGKFAFEPAFVQSYLNRQRMAA